MPRRHDRGPARHLPGAGVSRAEHRRLPAQVHAGHRRAQGAQGQVPRHRHPRPHGQPRPGRRDGQDGQGARRPEHPALRERRQLVGRPAGEHAGRGEGESLQGPLRAAGGHRLPQRRPGMGGRRREAARGRHQGRRPRRRRGVEGIRAPDQETRWQPPPRGRPRARSGVGRLRAARRARVHPHRGAPGILPAARHAQRALAGARALPR